MAIPLLARALVGCLLLLAYAPEGVADDWRPSHHCMKPVRPYQFTADYERDAFKREVDQFERCIDDFISAQKSAAQNHADAAKRAVDEWNLFVRTELR